MILIGSFGCGGYSSVENSAEIQLSPEITQTISSSPIISPPTGKPTSENSLFLPNESYHPTLPEYLVEPGATLEIAEMLITDWLNYYQSDKIAATNRLEEYTIQEIKLLQPLEEGFIISASVMVTPTISTSSPQNIILTATLIEEIDLYRLEQIKIQP